MIVYYFVICSLLFPLWSVQSQSLVYPQYRRFQPSQIVHAQAYRNFLSQTEVQMAYVVLYVSRDGFLTMQGMGYREVIESVWTVRSHSAILVISVLSKVHLVMAQLAYSRTPQIWVYANVAVGPLGPEVYMRDVMAMLGNPKWFMNEKILAVAWTRPSAGYDANVRYEKQHADDMVKVLKDSLQKTIVLCFDAILLSRTIEMLQWFPMEYHRMALLIRLFNYKDARHMNMTGLREFVTKTKMGPIFFDMPDSYRLKLIDNLDKFKTPPPAGSNGNYSHELMIVVHCIMLILCSAAY